MANATKATIDRGEAEHFGRLAADWWNPKGSSAMLHRLNPARLAYVREVIDAHFDGDGMSFAPLAGKTALDVGCGAGLLAEPLARMGARVTGLDAAVALIEVLGKAARSASDAEDEKALERVLPGDRQRADAAPELDAPRHLIGASHGERQHQRGGQRQHHPAHRAGGGLQGGGGARLSHAALCSGRGRAACRWAAQSRGPAMLAP